MKHVLSLLLLASLLLTGMALASEDKLAAIVAQQREIAATLDAGGDKGMTNQQVTLIREAQTKIFAITDGVSSLDQLNAEQQVRLDNALEVVGAQTKGTRLAGDKQDSCWRQRPTGSNIAITRCGTRAEKEQAREDARGFMQGPRVCSPGEGTCGSMPD